MPAHLLTTLGTGDYKLARWRLGADDRTHETHYAPVATVALVGDIAGVTVLLTDEARDKHWDAFRAEIDTLGIELRAERIPPGRSETEIWEVFSTVDRVLRPAREVVLDATHAFRSLPLVLFGSLTYLAALRDVRVRGVYYGAWEARSQDVAPLLDLSPLLALVQWTFGVRGFRETGSARWLAQLVREARTLLFRRQGPSKPLERLQAALRDLGWAIPAGLPLESGMHARIALDALQAIEGDQPELVLLRPLLDEMRDRLGAIAVGSRVERKSAIALDAVEMARQLQVARLYHQWGLDDRALLLLREWVISRSLLATGRGERWLIYGDERRPTEQAINALGMRSRLAARDASSQSPLPSLWDRIARLRNELAHAGMVPEVVGPVEGKVARFLSEFEAESSNDATWSTARPGATRRLLVTPLGRAPGVLFTALARRAPDVALVVTSREARPKLDEACARAGWRGTLDAIEVADAHTCFAEVTKVVDRARPHLLEAREVDVNITGGTTAMQYLAERVAGEAGRLGVPCQRIALIDRRGYEEQQREPYVAGDVITLAGDEPGGASRDD